MATTATNERGRFRFRVSEYSGRHGTPWIMTDPLESKDRLKVLGESGFIGFDLKPRTTIEQARKIAEYLNEHINSISCTLFH